MPRHPLRQPPAGWQLYFHEAPDPGDPVLGAKPPGWYVLQGWRFARGPYTERWYAVQVAERLETKEAAAENGGVWR